MNQSGSRWLALAWLALAALPPAWAADQTIATGSVSFLNPNRSIQVGEKVTWSNASHGFHNVTSDSFRCANGCDGEGGNGGASTAAWSFTRTFSTPGTFVYWCEIHGSSTSGMRGVITVTAGGAGSLPAAPSNLKASALSKTEIQLTWKDNATNESGFVIEMRSGTGDGPFALVETVGANVQAATVDNLGEASYATFRVHATNGNGVSANSNLASATTDSTPGACVDDDDTLCLNDDRFRVETAWETSNPTQTGIGHRVELTPDTGYFWFFAPTNVEMVVKVLTACGLNSRYWVFAGGLTNVKVVITVTDSETGKVVTYVNPLNAQFQPIQDTGAFATCP